MVRALYVIGDHLGHVAHLLPLYSKLGGKFLLVGSKEENKTIIKNALPDCEFFEGFNFDYHFNVVFYADWNEFNNINFALNQKYEHKSIWIPHGLGTKELENYPKKIADFDLYLATSFFEMDILQKEKVNLKNVSLVGYPKFDFSFYQHYIHQNSLDVSNFILYAPTWGGYSSLPFIYSELKSLTDNNETVVIKPHPVIGFSDWGDVNFQHYKKIINELPIVNLDKNLLNILPLIKKSSLVITDASAVAFESVSMGKKVQLTKHALRDSVFMEKYNNYTKNGMSAPFFHAKSLNIDLASSAVEGLFYE